jgi:NTE family protein
VYSRKAYSLGYLLEAVASTKPLFTTFKSNVLSAPAFNPLQDSKTLYLEHFRANNYGAFGLKNVFGIHKNIDLRLEAYIFQPLRTFKPSGNQDTSLGDIFGARYYAATAGLVYHSPVGPLSLSFNHYDDDQKRYGIMFHIGYLIYNKRSFE